MATTNNYEIKQFRYFGAGDERNSPEYDIIWLYGEDPSDDNWEKKHLFSDINGGVVKLGIQGLPGTIFYLSDDPLTTGIIIDHTGVYELDLTNTTLRLDTLYFDSDSLLNISQVENSSLIVDILYEKT